jgi:hypothetical protein
MKDWEIIADNLSNAGWSWGYVSAVDSQGRTIRIADAHRGDGASAIHLTKQRESAERILPLGADFYGLTVRIKTGAERLYTMSKGLELALGKRAAHRCRIRR